MSNIQLRIDEETKRTLTKILDELGLDMSSAIKVYLKQIIATKGIPFPLVTRNGMTPEQEQDILQASKEAKRGRGVTKKMAVKEAMAYLDSLKK
jgi:DNA-damage-inducible protein J